MQERKRKTRLNRQRKEHEVPQSTIRFSKDLSKCKVFCERTLCLEEGRSKEMSFNLMRQEYICKSCGSYVGLSEVLHQKELVKKQMGTQNRKKKEGNSIADIIFQK